MKRMLRMMMAVAVLFAFNIDTYAQIRINEIGTNGVDFEGASKWVELHNAGDSEVDVSGLFLCDFPLYPSLGSLTVLGGGSMIVPAGGFVVVAWPTLDNDNDGTAEVGLYVETTSDFGDSGSISDYVQYGGAGHFRETTAQAVGLWAVGDFVPGAASGSSLQLVDNAVNGVANWVERPATPNTANGLATGIEDTEVPSDFALYTNFPNPFNPTTTISYDLSRAGQVALDVYDMLGQKVTSLFKGGQVAGSYTFSWDGKDAGGNVVSSGVYLYRLTLDGQARQSRVMTLLK